MKNSNSRDEPGKRQEKRNHHRMPCSAAIEFAIQDQIHRNLSRDISESGVFIETWDSFPVGEEVTLTVPLSNNPEGVKVAGKVVRADNKGIGIKFL